jgi:hypothetical protein
MIQPSGPKPPGKSVPGPAGSAPSSTAPPNSAPPSKAELKANLSKIAATLTVLKLQYKVRPADPELAQSIKQLEDAEELVRKTLRDLS